MKQTIARLFALFFLFALAACPTTPSADQPALQNESQAFGAQATGTGAAVAMGAPSMFPITVCPESNADTTPMVWPNWISVRSAVDGHGIATLVTVEVDTQPTFATAVSYDVARGNIGALQALNGPCKVGRHIGGLVPSKTYYIRFAAVSRAGKRLSPVLIQSTPAEGVNGTPVSLVFDSLDAKSSTELKPYWRGEKHNGKRFAWKYEWWAETDPATVLGTYSGFYDGPSQSVGTSHPRAEFKWTMLDLKPKTKYVVKLATWNRFGHSDDAQTFVTDDASGWLGTVDQKSPADRWGWLHCDPRDMMSPKISETEPMRFGADTYDGTHTKASTTGEDAYTVFVDHTGYSRMWVPVGDPARFTASVDSGALSGSKTSNIAQAVRALKGIGGSVRVAYDAGKPYAGGEYGGLSNAGSPRAKAYEAWWDNGVPVTDPSYRAYPITYVRIQACDVNKKPQILNGLNITDSHGGVNGIYFYGLNFRNSGSNASSVFMPGYAVGGIVGCYKCRFDVDPASSADSGYGIKWHEKGTGCYAYDNRWNQYTAAHEHFVYGNSPGACGNVDSYIIGNRMLRGAGYNKAGVSANGRTGWQFDSRGDLVAAGNALTTQTGLAPGRGTIWFVDNEVANGSGKGGGSGGKGISIPGHFGRVVIDQHMHLSDPDGNDYGFMNTVEDPQKGCWLNDNGFAVGEVEIRKVSWKVSNTIANMYICQSTETVTILQRPDISMNNRIAFAFSEVTQPPFPRSAGMIWFTWAGTADNALRKDLAWPSNLSAGNKIKHEFSTSINGSPVFDDSAIGAENFNRVSRGFVFEAIN